MIFTKNQLIAVCALTAASVSAFNVQPLMNTRAPTSSTTTLFMADYDDSYPSDSSEDTHFTVEKTEDDSASSSDGTIDVENKPSTPSETVVTSIMDYLPSTISTSGEITAEDRASINESVLKLEALNPTEDPVYSPLLNGVWNLRYAGGYSESKIPSPTRDLALFLYSGGYSPGLFALSLAQKLPAALVELGDLEICKCTYFMCMMSYEYCCL